MPTPLQKRANDVFVSYGHADQAVVEPTVDWLRRSAGLRVWYDDSSGNAAQRTTDLLSGGIGSARGALFFISPNWSASTWCRDEHEVALTERRNNSEFVVVAAQIAECEIPTWFKASQVLDLRKLDAVSALALLRALSPGQSVRIDNDQDIYYAGPWTNQSEGIKNTFRILFETGWRLVGDSQDHSHYSDSAKRIAALLQSSRGLFAVLPHRSGPSDHHTSPWVVDEVRIAKKLGKPYLLLAEDGVIPPHDIVDSAHEGRAFVVSADRPGDEFHRAIRAFDDVLSHVSHSRAKTYSFLAASLLGDTKEGEALVAMIENATNMPCVRGQYLTGQHAQEAIVQQIRDATFVIADVTDDNRNSLIEAGVARGSGVPLHLICRPPASGSRKTRFMLKDIEINWYNDSLERIGAAYRIARNYRRHVFVLQDSP